jgi:hypothetical protein
MRGSFQNFYQLRGAASLKTVVFMKMAVFWVVTSRNKVYGRFTGACCARHQGYDGGSRNPCNGGKPLPNYTG